MSGDKYFHISSTGTNMTDFTSSGLPTVSIEGKLNSTKFTDETVKALKDALGYSDVVVKCGHCGQWGAVKTACKHCGAAVG